MDKNHVQPNLPESRFVKLLRAHLVRNGTAPARLQAAFVLMPLKDCGPFPRVRRIGGRTPL